VREREVQTGRAAIAAIIAERRPSSFFGAPIRLIGSAGL
jgi:hypothetical protein